jgi:hypothetical protein
MSTHFPFTISDDEAALIRAALDSKLTILNNLALNVRARDRRADHSTQASETAHLMARLDGEIAMRTTLPRRTEMQQLIIYLDTDANGDDLLDNAGNPIPAGWYRYDWPLSAEPEGPFESELDAGDGIAL